MFKELFLIALLAVLNQGSPIPDDNAIESRIVGGSNAFITEFPFMVSLRAARNFHFCGGSILNNRWVLSAAHCTFRRAPNSVNVVVGTSFLYSGGTAHVSSRIVNHPSYNDNNLRNDISLVQVATAFSFGSTVASISLPTSVMGSGSGIVAGWGYITPRGPVSDQLQRLNVEIMSHEACHARIRSVAWFEPNKICSLTRDGQGSCIGDSGGPMFVGRTVVGVVSFGFVPCGSNWPDVLERVFSHRSWILSII